MQRVSLAAVAAVSIVSLSADAHISISSGPAFANKSGQKITLGISHGCNDTDTVKVKITIPSAITSVRALYSDFGRPSVQRDANDSNPATNIRSITWTKTDTALEGDFGFYEITFRAKVADVPFSQIQLNVQQTCEDGTVEEWDQPATSTTGNPAPLLKVVPSRLPGWNKVTLGTAVSVDDLPVYFGDALIVWKGNSAFSTNANTRDMILATPGVTELTTALAAGDEIWVKY